MKSNKLISCALSVSMLLSAAVMPIASADDEQQVSSSWTENMDRGLTAVPLSNGVYLSWRLQEDEDNRFGSGDKNVEFDIYRDGEKIATESNTTNYIDANGTSSSTYAVVKSGESLDSLKTTIDYTGKTITVNAAKTGLTVYAVKYKEDGALEKISSFDIKQTGTQTFTTDFDVDKAFIWDGMTPMENTESGAALMMSSGGYIDIPLVLPEDETITDSSGNSNTYSFAPTDCSAGDVDGDGEYEIIVKFVSHELDVGNAGYSGTVRFNAYKLDGTRLWKKDINLGRNVFSSAHTAQFLVYDFDGDGKAEMTVQTSLGSTDSTGDYVSKVSAQSSINSLTDTENAEADFREVNNGRITSGQEFLTVFNGETGEAIDTIDYPTNRVSVSCWGKNDGGNRSQRFLADVAYLDGEKPYAVYWRGYYNHDNGRTGIAGVSFDGERLSVDYIFDTRSGQPGYTAGNSVYAGEGNHNLTVADVDNDGKDEVISGAMCMEVDDNNKLMPKWCTFRGHGDALHIGDYDPTHDGYEFFTVHEEGGVEEEGVTLDYGMSVIDAATGEIIFHQSNTKDTGRGMMANVGSGGYYQITGIGTYQCNGGTDFTATNNGMGNNFRVFWDGDLYDELLNGTDITSWNGSTMASIFNASDCTQINGTKANPSLQADLFGDWREEVVYPTSDGKALRVFTTTTKTDYKIKSLMYDKVYRMGVAAEQTTYNQPPHIGFYLSDDLFYGTITDIVLDTTNVKTTYYVGEEFDKSGITVTGKYSDAADKTLTEYSVSGFDSMKSGEQTVTITYTGVQDTYTAEITVNVVSGLTIENGVVTGYGGDDTEIVIPTTVIENGAETAVTEIADGAFVDTSLEKIYIYSNDIVLNGDNIFPSGVTIACFENSTAYQYASEHGIDIEIIKTGDSVTFDEEFYDAYAGKNMLMQSNAAATLKDEFIAYNTHAADSRAPWYKADTYGFKIASGNDGNYLNINAGIYDSQNSFNQVYITLNTPKSVSENQTISFDVMFPSNSGSPYVELQNDKETVIDTISGLTADTWYHYQLSFNDGVYTRTITDSNGNVVGVNQLSVTNGSTVLSNIVFKQTFSGGMNSTVTGIVNIDNLLLN